MDNKRTLGAEVFKPIYEKYEELAANGEFPISVPVKNALYAYIERHEDVELSDTLQKVIDNQEEYKRIREERLYRQLENKRISETLMKSTYRRFMDSFLAEIYLSNSEYMGEDELKELMRSSMGALKNRAEHYDMLEAYQARKEDPLNYAKEYVESEKVRDKAFDNDDYDPS